VHVLSVYVSTNLTKPFALGGRCERICHSRLIGLTLGVLYR
jgi:hypothetical protein